MAVKIKSLKNAVADNGIKVLVHGPAGAGKTVLSCTAGVPTLIISAESGLLSVQDAPDYIKAAEIESLDDLEDLYEYLVDSQDERDFEWVALDSITEIAEQVLAYEKKQAKDPRQAYGMLQERIMDLLRRFRDLKGYNVYMSCKQQRIADDGGPSVFCPMMPGTKLHQQIPYLFDEVFALRVEKDEDGVEYRILQTGRDVKFEAKDRSGALDMFEEPNLKYIAAKIRGTLPDAPEVKEEVVEEVVEEVKKARVEIESEDEVEEIEEVENPDGLEESEEELILAEKKMYWYHAESESVGFVEKGDPINDYQDQVDFVSRMKYLELKKEIDAAKAAAEEE